VAAKKTTKKAVKSAVKPATDKNEPHLPTGIGDDLIPVSLLLRYNTFVEEYLQTLDCAEAARAAGWDAGKNHPRQRSWGGALLRNPYVRTMIDQQYRAIMAKTKATVERVWEEISLVAFLDPAEAFDANGDPLPIPQIPEHVRRAITGRKKVVKTFGEDGESVEEELKFGNKDAALDKLMKLHRMTDNDKYVIVNGEEFVAAMEEGRQRAASRSK
jgi:hypothetical protein